jgi:hypothetical protein
MLTSVNWGKCPLGVKLRRTHSEQMSSGLPLIADIAQYSRHVSKVPLTDVSLHGYRIKTRFWHSLRIRRTVCLRVNLISITRQRPTRAQPNRVDDAQVETFFDGHRSGRRHRLQHESDEIDLAMRFGSLEYRSQMPACSLQGDAECCRGISECLALRQQSSQSRLARRKAEYVSQFARVETEVLAWLFDEHHRTRKGREQLLRILDSERHHRGDEGPPTRGPGNLQFENGAAIHTGLIATHLQIDRALDSTAQCTGGLAS